jgi:hypothetical protein
MSVDVVHFGFIVEGHGEVQALPLLVRRICGEVFGFYALETTEPVRFPKSKLVHAGGLEQAIQIVRAEKTSGPIIAMLDADDDCPAELGPQLKSRATAICGPNALSIIIPKYEFETWFLTAVQSLAGKRGLREGVKPPERPEAVRGAKQWLSQNMDPGRRYRETVDQAALVHAMDLNAARSCPSFERLCREIQRLLQSSGHVQIESF